MKTKKEGKKISKIENFFLNTILPILLVVYLIMFNIVWCVKLTLSLGDLGTIIFVTILMVEVPITIFVAIDQRDNNEKRMLVTLPTNT